MKLLGSLTSPYVRKVRIVMAEKKLDYDLLLKDVWEIDSHAVQKHNPLGKIPCLIMDDYGSLFDSRVIVEYLDTLSPVGRLLPQSGRDRASTKAWEAVADGLMDAAQAIRIELHRRQPAQQSSEWVERQQEKITAALQYMEDELAANSPYCMGINFNLADIAVGCALGFLDFRYPEITWRNDYPKLTALQERLDTRPSFIATKPPAAEA